MQLHADRRRRRGSRVSSRSPVSVIAAQFSNSSVSSFRTPGEYAKALVGDLRAERRIVNERLMLLQVTCRGIGSGPVVHVRQSLKVRNSGDVRERAIAEQDRSEILQGWRIR